MKIDRNIWLEKMDNLMKRRASRVRDDVYASEAEKDFASHFSKCKLGQTVLEVGCGECTVKEFSPGLYFGIDPFPMVDFAIKAEIEAFNSSFHTGEDEFETIVAFQVLDGLYDLDSAIKNMKALCTRNIIIMVRFGIPPDEYHTIEITEDLLNSLMSEGEKFGQTYREELSPKIFLIEYSRQ